jgi:hypothetical protein
MEISKPQLVKVEAFFNKFLRYCNSLRCIFAT